MIGCNFAITLPSVGKWSREGRGYSGVRWQNSELLGFIRSLPDHIGIYASCPDEIRFLVGRTAFYLPAKYDPMSRVNNEKMPQEFAAVCEALAAGRAVAADCLNRRRPHLLTVNDIKDKCRGFRDRQLADAHILLPEKY
jgi:hypothetical protein